MNFAKFLITPFTEHVWPTASEWRHDITNQKFPFWITFPYAKTAVKEIAQLLHFIDDIAFISQVTEIHDFSIHIWTTQLIQLALTNGCYQTQKFGVLLQKVRDYMFCLRCLE